MGRNWYKQMQPDTPPDWGESPRLQAPPVVRKALLVDRAQPESPQAGRGKRPALQQFKQCIRNLRVGGPLQRLGVVRRLQIADAERHARPPQYLSVV